MAANERELDRLLDRIEAEVDEDHLKQVDARYRQSLAWQNVDRPPLVVQSGFARPWMLPEPWNGFMVYPHRQAFDDPVAMMQNQLLDRIVPALILRDDSPLAIRADHGTIQIASALGGAWHQHEDNPPWIEPLGDNQVHQLIECGAFDVGRGVVPRSTRTLQFYREKLASRPRTGRVIQIALPDLQGPIDTAEQLWGGEVMLAILEQPELVARLMDTIARAMLAAIEHYRPLTRERLAGSGLTTQHGYQIPGQLLIRDDSAILISPHTYAEAVLPHDRRVLEAVGGGSIHFCGNGTHLVESMLKINSLRGIDLGESFLVDLPAIYAACGVRQVAVTHVMPGRENLVSGEAVRRYPTGVVFAYETRDIEDAREVLAGYEAHSGAYPVETAS